MTAGHGIPSESLFSSTTITFFWPKVLMAGRPKSTYYIYVNFELDLSVQFTVIGLIRSCCNVFVQYLVGGYCMPKKYSPFFASLYINVLGHHELGTSGCPRFHQNAVSADTFSA